MMPDIEELEEYFTYDSEYNQIRFMSSSQNDSINLRKYEGESSKIKVKLIDQNGNEFEYEMDLIIQFNSIKFSSDLP